MNILKKTQNNTRMNSDLQKEYDLMYSEKIVLDFELDKEKESYKSRLLGSIGKDIENFNPYINRVQKKPILMRIKQLITNIKAIFHGTK
jgi:hypothetical protein